MNQTQTTATAKLFIGLDVHKKSWTVHFKTELSDNKTITLPPDTAVLINYVQKYFEGHQVICCYEAGCFGYWIARDLHCSNTIICKSFHLRSYGMQIMDVF